MRAFAIICIVAGALIIFTSGDSSSYAGYLKIVGFILLMFGLYKCTKFWVQERQEEDNEQKKSNEHDDLASKN